MFQLADTVNYTRVQILDLFEETIDFRVQGTDAVVCGWGAVTKKEPRNVQFRNSKHSDKLHCMFLKIRNNETCRNSSRIKIDYRRKVMCGKTKESEQSILSVNTL